MLFTISGRARVAACAVALTLFSIVFAPSFAAQSAAATSAPLAADLVHSRAEFTVSHMVLSKVWGHIPIRALEVDAQPGNTIPTKIDATLDPAHEDTDNHDRDADLRSATYFDVATYPTIVFRSTKIAPSMTSPSDFTVEGDLTIKNVTKHVTFPAHVIGVIPDGAGSRVGYSAELHVDRRDFNMVDEHLTAAGVLLVGYDVTIGLTVEATSPARLASHASS